MTDNADNRSEVRAGDRAGENLVSAPLTEEESPAQPPLRFVDGFGLVLALILLAYLIAAIVDEQGYGPELTLVVLATTAWMALRAAGVRARILRYTLAIIPFSAAIAIFLALDGDERTIRLVTGVITGLLVIVAPAVILRRLNEHRIIDLNTLFGAVCIYLLIAMFFATAFSFSAAVTDQPFFAQDVGQTRMADYLYFSLTTITTVGYGDLTAREDVGRMMAVFEAVLGQLYLVSVIALVVQNLGQARHRMRRGPG